jgi:hypothetical protein
MAEPWFDPNVFGAYFGAIGGGVGGTLGGLWGALAGWLAPRGKAKLLVVGLGWLILTAAVGCLGLGVYALTAGQPYGIWYPPLLVGIVIPSVVGGLLPMVYRRYRQADQRKMQAEEFRHE